MVLPLTAIAAKWSCPSRSRTTRYPISLISRSIAAFINSLFWTSIPLLSVASPAVRMGFRWKIDLPRYIFFVLWMATNISLFIGFFLSFQLRPQYHYMRIRTKHALAFARGPANVINLNTALVLLPICRNLVSLVRGCCKFAPRGIRTLLDKNLTFHQWFAWAIVVGSIVHVVAHWYNYERFAALYNLTGTSVEGFAPLNSQPIPANITTPIAAIRLCFTTYAGVTGHIMVLVLFLMVTSSVEFIRRKFFEVFWYTHHLFAVYLVALGIHQYERLLPVQNNTDMHDPVACSVNETVFNSGSCSATPPDFSPAGPTSWMWFLGPLFIYIVERVIRFAQYFRPVTITKVVEHPSKVYEIQMKRPFFKSEVGQYIFINSPRASLLEWHPFTMTSSPEEDTFSVHIRVVGDWTESLAKALGVGSGSFKNSKDLPRIFVDGPFGTASEDVFNYEVGVLVGAGIGITPFASVLKSIWYKLQDERASLKLKRVYFFWIAPDTKSFEWFSDLLHNLEQQMIERGVNDFLLYNIYLTRGWDDTDAKQIMLYDTEGGDPITGLQQRTHYGKPSWDSIFDQLSLAHPGTDVGVFFCGPKVLSHVLHKSCNKSNKQSGSSRAQFFYNKENF